MRPIPSRLWVGAVLSGLLQVLPFPLAGPVPPWRSAICWIALTPLLWALLEPDTTPRPLSWLQGALLGYAAGAIWYLGSCYWIYQTMNRYGGLAEPVAFVILILFSLYLGLYHALFGGVIALLNRSSLGRQGALLLSPFVWVAVELARAHITGFPWNPLGMTQVDHALLTRLAPFTGVFGISFVVAAVNALWLVRIQVKDRPWTRPTLTAISVAIIAAYAFFALHPRPAVALQEQDRGTATLLQENLEVGAAATGPPESEKQLLQTFSAWSLRPAATLLDGTPELPGTRVLRRLPHLEPANPERTGQTSQNPEPAIPKPVIQNSANPAPPASPPPASPRADGSPLLLERSDVVIWPESPAPFEEQDPAFRSAVSELARTESAPVIVGNIGADKTPPTHGAPVAQLPYNSASFIDRGGAFLGRYDKMHLVPFGEYTPFKRLFFFAGHLLDEVGTFQPGTTRRTFGPFGVFICYESIFGDEIRQLPTLGATVLVNISNDGWYGDTSAPWQHLNMVRMRAIENHRWVLRATNTGITAAIDPAGRVVAAAPRHIRTAIRVPFAYEHDLTFYSRHGDLFAYLCTAITLGALAFALLRPSPSRPR